MRKNDHAARGTPLAALLSLVVLILCSGAVMGEGILEVAQILEPDEIFVARFDEDPRVASLTLSLGSRSGLLRHPVDLLFVIDISATSDLVQAKQFAFDLIERIGPQDRIGVVSYGSTANLEVPLGSSLMQVRGAIADLVRGGKSALGAGLQLARKEMEQRGRSDALLVEILLGDGQSNAGIGPEMEGRVAADLGIMINAVGLGPLINRSLLEALTEETGGLFFDRPSDRARFDLWDHVIGDIAAQQVEVEKVLPEGLRLRSATPAPVRVETDLNGETTIVWRLGTMMLGREVTIELQLEAIEPGRWPSDLASTVKFEDFRGVESTVAIHPLTITAVEPNQAPIALFDYAPKHPTTLDTVEFSDRSADVEEAGDVVAWAWDFDDGSISAERDPEHRFATSGTYRVTLVVIDDRGLASPAYEVDLAVDEGPRVEATRTIDTCMPDDVTIPGETISVVLSIAANSTINGLAVTETVPEGWTFIEGENDGATLRRVGQTLEWLFVEMLVPGDINSKREIRYSLVAPATIGSGDIEQVAIQGKVGSSSPRFTLAMLGEDRVTMTRYLSIPVAISRWNAETSQLELCEAEPGIIDFQEIQYAISLWLSGGVVPQTNNKTIDLGAMQDLIAYWLTGSSVHDPLP